MQVFDLDGVETKWRIKGKEITTDTRPRSALHKAARVLLKARYPTYQILEEVSIKVRKGKTLYLDFYLPLKKLAVEVQGEQHFAFSTLFHTSRQDFLRQKRNDSDKAEWCEINGIDLVPLRYDQQDNWEDQI